MGMGTSADLGMRFRLSPLVAVLAALAVPALALADATWQLEPRVTVSETWTDNVGLDQPGQEESDFITQIMPGIAARKEGGRLRLVADYQLQSLVFARDGSRNDVYHRLFAKGDADLVEDWLFVDFGASRSQSIVDAEERLTLDNFNRTANRADVVSYYVSPYLRHDFGGRFRTEIGYHAEQRDYERGAADTYRQRVTARFSNGFRFTRLSWQLDYRDEILRRQRLRNPEFRSLAGVVGYRLWRGLSLVARAGKEDNSFSSVRRVTNGSYWSGGARWASRHFSVEALKGNNDQGVSVKLTPSARTTLDVRFRDRSVGLNPGVTWSGDFTHRTRRSRWNLRYFEDTITVQQLQPYGGNQVQLVFGGGTVEFRDPVTGDPVFLTEEGLFSLTDSVIERQRATATFGYRFPRHRLRLTLFDEQRDLLLNGGEQDARGGTLSWRWDVGVRTYSNLRYGRQNSTFTASNRKRDFRYWSLELSRTLRPDATGSLRYRYAEQDSGTGGRDRQENRLTLQLQVAF
ncbi:TIGR03016 family PEP-CTERM system-associated outer membrane protein [Thiohalobacter sp.]|uniref:TIGR03016 family PEP-CTERM system-associated outer membrane protein n=1 Tax=Thiohalobacter sp. TaxID=2025948 RepID=UPI0026374040|nr:TIGR03016 family PEP-CTERM system-associated outer membrane protein [Thiohalobacter sp.]